MFTDGHWLVVEPHLPRSTATTGRPARDRRQVFEAILWVLWTGSPWRALPDKFGPWQTAYDRFNRWRREGVFDRLAKVLREQADTAGRIDWSLFCLDGTSVRASRAAAGASSHGGTPTSRTTTRWAGLAAGLAPNCT